MPEVSDTLLAEVQNYLDITWTMSQEEKDKLKGMIARGMAWLTGVIGTCDFTQETQEKGLLFIYVMYERAAALDQFMKNYQGQIISLQINRKAAEYDANDSQ